MIAQCRPDVGLEEVQGFVVQGPHHANASNLVEGLVVRKVLGVRGRVAVAAEWSVVHPTPPS